MRNFIKMPNAFKKAMAKRVKTGRLRWQGNKNDLMEVVYVLYLSEQLKDPSNHNATFNEISETIYELFGLEPPQNPSRVVSSLKQRVDPVKLSIICQALSDLYPGFIRCLK